MKILIAGAEQLYPGSSVNWTLETKAFFEQDSGVHCDCSMDPEGMESYDAVIVPGDVPDVHPGYWGGQPGDFCKYDRGMDQAQFDLIDHAVALRKPLLGICRGHQLISAYFGATLEQDIPRGEIHRYAPDAAPKFHRTYSVPGTKTFQKLGAVSLTNSLHHQAVLTVPACLQVTQLWSPDKETASKYLNMAQHGTLKQGNADCIIEAVRHKDYPFWGLQWHPEMRGKYLCEHICLEKVRLIFYSMFS